MSSATFHLPVRAVARPRRPARRAGDLRDSDTEGTPILRLVGIAVLGWFSLMVVLTAFAL
jgi:hypothetical protein